MQIIPDNCRTAADFHRHYMSVRQRLPYAPKPRMLRRVAATEKRIEWPKAIIYPVPIGPTKPSICIGLNVTVPWADATVSPDAVLMHVVVPRGPKQIIRTIEKEICERENLTVSDLHGQRRTVRFVRARQEAIYRVSKATGWSLPRIGRHFGDRDHTTILHSIRAVQKRIDAGHMPVPPECA